MSVMERGEEWPCRTCDEMVWPQQFGDPRNAGAPADARCRAEYCKYDAECLEALHVALEKFSDALAETESETPIRYRLRLQDSVIEALAEVFADVLAEAGVPGGAIHADLLTQTVAAKRMVAA